MLEKFKSRVFDPHITVYFLVRGVNSPLSLTSVGTVHALGV